MKYCSYCGKPLEDGAKFCGKCGKEVILAENTTEKSASDQPADVKPIINYDEVTDKVSNNFLSKYIFGLNSEKFKSQISDYYELGLTSSYRGQAALAIIIVVCLSFLLAYGTESYEYYGAFIYIPLAYFIYKGKKLALMLTAILYSLDQLYNIYSGGGGIWPLIWWLVVVGILYRAYQVEKIKDQL
jgi:hypothetical protein